jgi:flavocytochrome c
MSEKTYEDSRELSRRKFLAGAGAALALGALSGCSDQAGSGASDGSGATGEGPVERWANSHRPPETWDRECDVLVVGGGGAGCMAAIEATEAGASVIVLEATDTLRGETAICGGGFAGTQSAMQKAKGIVDDPEAFVKDYRLAGEDLGDPEIIRAMAELSGSTIDKLVDLGTEFILNNDPPGENGHMVPRIHWSIPMGSGIGVMLILEETVLSSQAEVLFETRGTKLFRASDGRVVGAEAESKDGSTQTFKANKGVVLACGGPLTDFDRLEAYLPALKEMRKEADFLSGTWKGNDGILFVDAVAIGADWNNFAPYYSSSMAKIGTTFESGVEAGGTVFAPFFAGEGAIEVNIDGKRFCNEPSYLDVLFLNQYRDQPSMKGAYIFDSKILAQPMTKALLSGEPVNIEQMVSNGISDCAKADTLEELASKLGIDPAGLVSTVDTWNGYVKVGNDPDFGRTEFGLEILEPPFYGIFAFPSISMLKGGLKINTDGQVLDNYAEPILGLYAAGEIASGQIQGSARVHLGGGGTCIALNYGRICGKNAALGA